MDLDTQKYEWIDYLLCFAKITMLEKATLELRRDQIKKKIS